MSGMSNMLRIALYRDVPPHHEPNERGGLPLGTLLSRKAVPPFPPFIPLVARGAVGWLGGMPSMLLMSLM